MIRFLKDRMISISSDLCEETLKWNKSLTNRIIRIVLCKTALTVKTVSTSIFRHVNNYMMKKHHGSKEKMFLLMVFKVFFKKIET